MILLFIIQMLSIVLLPTLMMVMRLFLLPRLLDHRALNLATMSMAVLLALGSAHLGHLGVEVCLEALFDLFQLFSRFIRTF